MSKSLLCILTNSHLAVYIVYTFKGNSKIHKAIAYFDGADTRVKANCLHQQPLEFAPAGPYIPVWFESKFLIFVTDIEGNTSQEDLSPAKSKFNTVQEKVLGEQTHDQVCHCQ